jgi:hypothetical protein
MAFFLLETHNISSRYHRTSEAFTSKTLYFETYLLWDSRLFVAMLEQEATSSKNADSGKIILLLLAEACNITLVYNPLIVTNTTKCNTTLTIQILLFHKHKK